MKKQQRASRKESQKRAAAGKRLAVWEAEKLFAEDLIFTATSGLGSGVGPGNEVASLFRRRLGRVTPSDVIK